MPNHTVKQLPGPLFRRKAGKNRNPFHYVCRYISTSRARLSVHVIWVLLFLGYHTNAQSQTLLADITARPSTPAKIHIALEFPAEVSALSFRNTYGAVLGLAERISNPQANSRDGLAVKVEKRAPGEFKLSGKAARVSYEVDLTEPARLENMSHISWLNSQRGLLMPADLLPRSIDGPGSFSEVRVRFGLPSGWTVSANVEQGSSGEFLTNKPDTAVFLVGHGLETKNKQLGQTTLKFSTAGKWPFSNDDAVKAAANILDEYSNWTGFPLKNATVMLIPFPAGAGVERWTAEARGNAVVLLMGNQGNRKSRLNRLGILLSHELFHLWVPNSLKLEGDYDWFFEGFTLYQALLADVKLGLISFDDYLDTLARVYRSYLAVPSRDSLSLIGASERRWTTSSSVIYDKGMLVAFLSDLALRNDSKCGASLRDIYRELFRSASTRQENANETIIQMLKRAGMDKIVREYVEGRHPIDLESQVAQYGLDFRSSELRPRLTVRRDVNDSQLRLLKCLGYRK